MRMVLAILGLALVGVIGAVFYFKDRGGLPSIDVDAYVPGGTSTGGEAPVRVYRWRNSEGAWVYGDTPPAAVEAEPVEIRPNIKPLPAD